MGSQRLRFDSLSQAKLGLILGAAVWAAMSVIVLSQGGKTVTLAVIGAALFPLVVFVSGNPRLLFLFGMIMAAPLGLSLNFRTLIHLGGSPSYSIDLVDFFLVPMVFFLLRDFIAGRRQYIRFSTVGVWWLALIVLGLYHVIMGPFRHLAGYETLRMLKHLLLFLVIVNECVRRQHFHIVLVALVLGMLLQIMIGYTQFILRADLGLQFLGEASPEATAGANLGVYGVEGAAYRVSALMGHPNLLSIYLALLLPIFIALLFTRYRMAFKIMLGAVSLLGCGLLVFTLSRSGWASFAAAFIVLLYYSSVNPALRGRYMKIKSSLVVMVMVAALVGSGPVIQRLTRSDEGAVGFRYEFMGVAWKMIVDKPIIGLGLNSFAFTMPPYTKYQNAESLNDKFGEHWPVVHNIYLLIAAEQGFLGLFLFLGVNFNLIWIARRNARQLVDDKLFALNIGALCGVYAVLIDGVASFFVRVPASGRMFWIVAGLIVAIDYWNRENSSLRKLAARGGVRLRTPGELGD